MHHLAGQQQADIEVALLKTDVASTTCNVREMVVLSVQLIGARACFFVVPTVADALSNLDKTCDDKFSGLTASSLRTLSAKRMLLTSSIC